MTTPRRLPWPAWAILVALTIGLFLALLFLFIRFLPMISIFEMRTIVPKQAASVVEEASE